MRKAQRVLHDQQRADLLMLCDEVDGSERKCRTAVQHVKDTRRHLQELLHCDEAVKRQLMERMLHVSATELRGGGWSRNDKNKSKKVK